MGIGASSVIGRLNTLRIAAFLMAGIAVADPAVVVQRRAPIAVDVRAGSAIHDRLARHLQGSVDFDSALEPAALVLTSGTLDVDSIPAGIPVSTISARNQGPNVSVLEVRIPAVLRPGWSAPIRALVRGTRMKGKSSVVALEQLGIELDATKHTWTREDETVELVLTYLPAAAGVRELQVMARPAGGEGWTDDNRIVSTVTVQDRRLKVLVHEPRPSWTAAFVRRALEDDPDFEVAALARVSKGLEVRAGHPAASISGDAIAAFDAVVVGAPEELQSREIDALETFVRRRGGTVVYLPDRRPSGAYASRLRIDDFSETLLPSPSRIAAPTGLILRGSEFITAGRLAPGADSLATVEQGGSVRPAVISWPLGAGRVIFSGALDAWRYRTARDDYARFWRATIGAGAAAAPGRVEVTLDPSAVAPGDTVTIRARTRATEFDTESSLISIPAIRARVVGEKDFDEAVRLWPSLELGEFEGRFQPPVAGRYDIHVALDGGGSSDHMLLATDEARRVGASEDAMRTLASRTGGVSVDESDLAPLVAHIKSLTRSTVQISVHPARSAWWMMGFVSIVSIEWLVRRRRGLR